MSHAKPIADRFWPKVSRGSPYECWEWLGTRDRAGYGRMSTRRGQAPVRAHRVSWELHYGAIPDGMVVRHKCDNPACVNPAHLLIGTYRQNMADAVERGRLNPKSQLNLRPGAPGFHGAGPLSRKEIESGKRQ